MHTCWLFLGLAFALRRYLVPDNFTASLSPDSKDWFLFYTHPDAGLANLEKDFLETSDHPKLEVVSFVLIDCSTQASLCESQGVTTYPTLRHHWNRIIKDYDWDLSAKDFYEFAHKLCLPPVLQLQRDEIFEKFKRNYELSFILWFYPNDFEDSWVASAQIYDRFAEEYRNSHIFFGRAARIDLRRAEGIDIGDLPMVKQYGADEAYDYNVKYFTEQSLREFVEKHKYSMLTILTRSLWKQFIRETEDKVVVIAFLDLSLETHKRKANEMRSIGWDLRTMKEFKYQLAYVDAPKEPGLAEQLGVTSIPTVVVRYQKKVYKVQPDTNDVNDFLEEIRLVERGEYPEIGEEEEELEEIEELEEHHQCHHDSIVHQCTGDHHDHHDRHDHHSHDHHENQCYEEHQCSHEPEQGDSIRIEL